MSLTIPIKVHSLVLLDESGSMNRYLPQVKQNLYDTLDYLKLAATTLYQSTQEHFLTVTTFGGDDRITHLYQEQPVKELNLEASQLDSIKPSGGTPLYLALKTSLKLFTEKLADPSTYLCVTILTDGQNNRQMHLKQEVIDLIKGFPADRTLFNFFVPPESRSQESTSTDKEFLNNLAGCDNVDIRTFKVIDPELTQQTITQRANFFSRINPRLTLNRDQRCLTRDYTITTPDGPVTLPRGKIVKMLREQDSPDSTHVFVDGYQVYLPNSILTTQMIR